MINVVCGGRESGEPTDDEHVKTVEGWILGQRAMDDTVVRPWHASSDRQTILGLVGDRGGPAMKPGRIVALVFGCLAALIGIALVLRDGRARVRLRHAARWRWLLHYRHGAARLDDRRVALGGHRPRQRRESRSLAVPRRRPGDGALAGHCAGGRGDLHRHRPHIRRGCLRRRSRPRRGGGHPLVERPRPLPPSVGRASGTATAGRAGHLVGDGRGRGTSDPHMGRARRELVDRRDECRRQPGSHRRRRDRREGQRAAVGDPRSRDRRVGGTRHCRRPDHLGNTTSGQNGANDPAVAPTGSRVLFRSRRHAHRQASTPDSTNRSAAGSGW